ncbi:NIL domain-containing protein [Chloroflexota bacterium]
MVKRRLIFTFPEELIREPIIYNLGQQCKVVTNIYRADVSESKAWLMLDLEGEEQQINEGIAWVTSKGVRVEPVSDT